MELIKITDLALQLGLTSRSLRYYEEAGLIQSVRPPGEKYRYFDEANIERLRQIIILRKMMIPIKDILRIYKSEDMSIVVDVFVRRVRMIDEESAALSELKRITDEFLQAMLRLGIKQISALPLLYEALANRELEKTDGAGEPLSYGRLSQVSQTLSKPIEPSIVRLPSMRVLSSLLKANANASDPDGFWRYIQAHGVTCDEPGSHGQFEYQSEAGDVVVARVADDFVNDGEYLDFRFAGGLYATINVYLDEDLAERFGQLVTSFDDNRYYQIDYLPGSGLRSEAMLEPLLSPDEKRELVALYVPVRKRLADPALFGAPEELAPGSITVGEIERANPILWSRDVEMDKLIPINSPHYRVTERGEAEYISWISTRVLSTNVAVKLPFRVDIEFRVGEESGGWGHGKNETSIRFHHGEDLNHLFGVNMDNSPDERLSREAICFHQPVFGDYFQLPKRGTIDRNGYNRLTWIVGLKHFAVILNGEVRYCGVNFPYMATELRLQRAKPIIMGSDSSIKKYFRAIRVSQLAQIPKKKIGEGTLTMAFRQSNNVIPIIHRLITSEFGENYWFNGCARYVMESLGEYKDEPDFGYWFFAGLTGDVLAQVYSYGEYCGECASACMFQLEGGRYFERIFERCGYASTFVSGEQFRANKEMYVQTLMAYIDKGVPVVAITHCGPPWGVYVGYEEYGKTLLFLTGDKSEPVRVPLEQIVSEPGADENAVKGLIFVGEKKRSIDLQQLYKEIVLGIPELFAVKNDRFCFGAEAFRAWADFIERGMLEGVTPDAFGDGWGLHVSNICNMATNGSCAFSFLDRAKELNPEMGYLEDVSALYRRMAEIWGGDDHQNDPDSLEALGGGFNVTLAALQDKDGRVKIAAKIREAAACMDKVLDMLMANIPKQ